MLKEVAEVVAYQEGIATVKCRSQSACGKCMAQKHCGTSALSELNGKRGEHIFTLACITPLKVGQRVEIGIQEKSMLFSAFLLYLVPLFTLVFATLISHYWWENEWLRVGFIVFLTALSLVLIKIFTQRLELEKEFQPVLLKVLG